MKQLSMWVTLGDSVSESTVGRAARVQVSISAIQELAWCPRNTLTWWWASGISPGGNSSQQLEKVSLGSCTAMLFSIKNVVIIHTVMKNLFTLSSHFCILPSTLLIKDRTLPWQDDISMLLFWPNSPISWTENGLLAHRGQMKTGTIPWAIFLCWPLRGKL